VNADRYIAAASSSVSRVSATVTGGLLTALDGRHVQPESS
jgi:hypothetical protein